MINRVLIRIKVVQMLYSYLLTHSEFRVDTPPEVRSRDIRYAYSAYIDLLLLIIELSGRPVRDGNRFPVDADSRLSANRVGAALAADDTLRTVILRETSGVALLDEVLPRLLAKIKGSAVYADYSRKTRRELDDDVRLWVTILETIIAKDPEVANAMRANPEFTTRGFEKAISDVCHTLLSYNDSRKLLVKSRKDLVASLDKAYELYLGLLKLIVELTEEQSQRLESAKNKFNVTSEDLNPNTRLVDNELVQYLCGNTQFTDLLDEYKLSSSPADPVMLRKLLDKILASDTYKEYLEKPVTDLATDTEFWREVMRQIVLPSEELAEDMEDKSVYWNDDLGIMGTFLLKTLRQIARSEGAPVNILPKYKDDEDSRFGPDLFIDAVNNSEQYRKYIDMFIDSKNWDSDRIAFMDIVIMIAAIAEIINYPKIPVPVTINEYIEIANHYSTGKSGAFINGILFSVIKYLNEQNIISK